MISILVPAYNEEKILEKNIILLYNFLEKNLKNYEIIILDSFSKDKTAEIAKKLEKRYKKIRYINIDAPGKGKKLRMISQSKSDFYAFIDSDLPIKLDEFFGIINAIIDGKGDLVVAFREKSERPFVRKIASKIGHIILKITLGIKVKDVFAGAKAWNAKVAREVWPLVKDESWFFDVELIYYCKKKGLKILEFPVTYHDERAGQFNITKGIVYITTKLIKFIFKH